MADIADPAGGDILRFETPEDHIAVITLDRRDRLNAIDVDLSARIAEVVRRVEETDDIWVAIVTGAGRAFCAGADLKDIAAGRTRALSHQRGGFAGFVRSDRRKPWIAAVNGPALGEGLELVLTCDMVVAAEDARFGLPETRLGLMALNGGLIRLPRYLPRNVALELIATGADLSAQRAYELGFVNRLVPDEEVLSAALDLARVICGNAQLAVRDSLAVARRSYDESEDDGWLDGYARRDKLARTKDFREGPRAFVEKRKPEWRGE